MQLHIAILPFFAEGHMIPALGIAKHFELQNVRVTIITTLKNAPTFSKAIEEGDKKLINLELLRFPAQEAGLPEGCESLKQAIKIGLGMKFLEAIQLLEEQLKGYLDRNRPNCIVADMFFPWATECAAKFSIPRIVFHGFGYFALCAMTIVRLFEPYKEVSSDDEPFALPLIPHDVKMVPSQIPRATGEENRTRMGKIMELARKSEVESFGVIVNSFYELEPDYAEFYRKELGTKAWHIGPVSLFNKKQNITQAEHESLMTWLDSKSPRSIIYLCFGSTTHSNAVQLQEIAMALENSGKNFLWVVDNNADLPQGFEERTEGKGLIISGWAPQVVILEHEAVGVFVTHCGWNSTLEGISAGVPMVTWPFASEQFYNEKLVTEIVRVGISVGVKKWSRMPSVDDVIRREVIEKALRVWRETRLSR